MLLAALVIAVAKPKPLLKPLVLVDPSAHPRIPSSGFGVREQAFIGLKDAVKKKQLANKQLIDARDIAAVPPFAVSGSKKRTVADTCFGIGTHTDLKAMPLASRVQTGGVGHWKGHSYAQMSKVCRSSFVQRSKKANGGTGGGRVALVLRGESFRNFGSQHAASTCCDTGFASQERVRISHQKLFDGIEASGQKVDL